jgi:hypothetical protein
MWPSKSEIACISGVSAIRNGVGSRFCCCCCYCCCCESLTLGTFNGLAGSECSEKGDSSQISSGIVCSCFEGCPRHRRTGGGILEVCTSTGAGCTWLFEDFEDFWNRSGKVTFRILACDLVDGYE